MRDRGKATASRKVTEEKATASGSEKKVEKPRKKDKKIGLSLRVTGPRLLQALAPRASRAPGAPNSFKRYKAG